MYWIFTELVAIPLWLLVFLAITTVKSCMQSCYIAMHSLQNDKQLCNCNLLPATTHYPLPESLPGLEGLGVERLELKVWEEPPPLPVVTVAGREHWLLFALDVDDLPLYPRAKVTANSNVCRFLMPGLAVTGLLCQLPPLDVTPSQYLATAIRTFLSESKQATE
jgi:hypothetical protein